MMVVVLAAAYAGCGPSSPSELPQAEEQVRDQKKIQELSKKGYDFSEIRSIMKGEDPKPRPKTKSAKARR
jgi:predicted small lipoprotein YifL